MKTALTIAGSDSCGGAGIQADIKTMTVHGVYAMSAITALTAQNTVGVTAISEVPPMFLNQQLACIFTDIRPDAVKIGMVPSAALIQIIADSLRVYNASNIVLDPVMIATSGSRLIHENAIEIMKQKLLPLATLITPNIPEAEVLSGHSIRHPRDMERAAENISRISGTAVLLKGGHCACDANDYLYTDGYGEWIEGTRIPTPNTHGTGCTLSSAIASNLAKGFSLKASVQNAKKYLTGALSANLNLGKGNGPIHHTFNLTGEFVKEAII